MKQLNRMQAAAATLDAAGEKRSREAKWRSEQRRGKKDFQIKLETDASDLLSQRGVSAHPDKNLIEEAQDLVARQWVVEISLVPRLVNSIADHLAKQALGIVPDKR